MVTTVLALCGAGATAAQAATCNGRTATIVGTAGNDILNGTAGDDVIAGLGGDDTINGLDGNDVLCGDEDPPFVGGTPGNDTLNGGDGNDTLISGPQSALNPLTENLSGGSGSDTVSYVTSPDGVTVDLLANVFAGGDADEDRASALDIENIVGSQIGDTLSGTGGDNVISGLAGADVINGLAGNDTIDAGAGNDDEIYGGDGNDQISGADGNDALFGEGGRDTLSGGDGDDSLFGGTGDDILAGEAGADDLVGGAGTDLADYSSADGPVSVNLGAAEVTGAAGADVPSSIEDISGSSFGDTLTGDAHDNGLAGDGGDDTIFGKGGNDLEDGGAGNDTFQEDAAANGADVFAGGPGNDNVNYAARTNPVSVTMNGAADDGEPGEGDNVLPDIDAATLHSTSQATTTTTSGDRAGSSSPLRGATSYISPNNDGRQDAFELKLVLPTSTSWTFTVQAGDRVVFTRTGRGTDVRAKWDGLRTSGRPVADGRYSWRLTSGDAGAETVVRRGTVVVDLRRPRVSNLRAHGRAVSLAMSEAGRVDVVVAGTRFGRSVARPGRVTVRWDGRGGKGRRAAPGSYRARIAIRDLAGNTVFRQASLTVRR